MAALVSPMMESTSKALGGGLLLIAGLFQFSRLKYACLAHCRSQWGFRYGMATWPMGAFSLTFAFFCCSEDFLSVDPHLRALGCPHIFEIGLVDFGRGLLR
jgi:hypothetical protein